MGEYAKFGGKQIKIGTCEDMLYLRADQAHMVGAESGSVNPADRETQKIIRFRFPWPDEDGIGPGGFDRPFRTVGFWGAAAPDGVEHGTVQFRADVGYLLSIPCPESSEGKAFRVHRNGFAGPVLLSQQKFWNGNLISVAQCGGCHHPYRLETLEMAQPLIDECERNAKSREMDAARNNTPGDLDTARWWREIAKRIARGYTEGM